MKILVTGLCLSRNLGGPAMALTLVEHLGKKYKEAEFIFAVPAAQFAVEKEWADRYGLNVVKRYLPFMKAIELFKVKQVLNAIGLLKNKNTDANYWTAIHRDYMKAIYESDLVVDMSGIAYIGDSAYKFLNGYRSYADFGYAKSRNKPFARFIQTFGPFEHPEVKFFAKKELNELDFIPARGRKSANMCREIVKEKSKVYDFPDIAICLEPASDEKVQTYFPSVDLSRGFMLVSPSSVIYNLSPSAGGCTGENYLLALLEVIKDYLNTNPYKNVLLLPHMYSYLLRECDRDKCRKLLALCTDPAIKKRISLVEQDINPMEAKAIISKADIAIVSRYHALVAALSTATPAIAIGWNVKYEDLLEYYQMDQYAIDSRHFTSQTLAAKVNEFVKGMELSEVKSTLQELQLINRQKVENGFRLLETWIDKSYNKRAHN